ncbi:MAG: GNAT family N-acetyltransferase [Rhodospirillales bacterium]|nr:GNAT family N-acetyltransferase [Rhodospirillales bacterium]
MTDRVVHIPTFETERLILRGPEMADGEAFAQFMTTDRSNFVGGPWSDYRQSTRAFGHMSGLWVLRGYSAHVWTLKDGTIIGHGGPWYPATWPEPEFGWILYSADHEGKGYVTEAMMRLRDWAWDNLGLKNCVAYIDPDNYSSRAVAKRLGGTVDPEAMNPFDDDPVVVWRFYSEGRA